MKSIEDFKREMMEDDMEEQSEKGKRIPTPALLRLTATLVARIADDISKQIREQAGVTNEMGLKVKESLEKLFPGDSPGTVKGGAPLLGALIQNLCGCFMGMAEKSRPPLSDAPPMVKYAILGSIVAGSFLNMEDKDGVPLVETMMMEAAPPTGEMN